MENAVLVTPKPITYLAEQPMTLEDEEEIHAIILNGACRHTFLLSYHTIHVIKSRVEFGLWVKFTAEERWGLK